MTSRVWQAYTFTVQVAAAGTSGVQMLSFDDSISRVRIDLTQARDGTEPAGSTWTVQRSTDLVRWSTVRGGDGIAVSATALPLDDYEFTAGQQDHYRAQVFSDGSLVHTYTDAITPLLSTPWLKSLTRPYLNTAVAVADASEFTRRSRVGLFDVVGARTPVAVTDVRAARAFTLTLVTTSSDSADNLDALIDSGDVLFFHAPDGYPVPTGYYLIGDTSSTWRGLPPAQDPTRWLTLPLTTVAAPSLEIVGATTNWEAVVAQYATWTDLADAVGTWNDVADAIAGVGDIVVDMA